MESTGRPTTTFVRPFLTAARSARPRTDGPAPAAAGSPQRGTAHLQGGRCSAGDGAREIVELNGIEPSAS